MGGADQYSGQPRGAPPLRVILFSQKTVEILAAAAQSAGVVSAHLNAPFGGFAVVRAHGKRL